MVILLILTVHLVYALNTIDSDSDKTLQGMELPEDVIEKILSGNFKTNKNKNQICCVRTKQQHMQNVYLKISIVPISSPQKQNSEQG